MKEVDLGKIQKNNWKQGVIVENPLKERLISDSQFYDRLKDSDGLVLYTQDCDLINLSLDKEPFVEFFCVKKVESINNNFSFGKNPRKIHVKVGDDIIYEFDINKRLVVDRSVLTDISLDVGNQRIPKNEMDVVLEWFSKKYSRPAFPDAFNDIIRDIPKIDRKLTKLNSEYPSIKRLFFSIEPDREIADTDNYHLTIRILLAGLSFESDVENIDEIVLKFEELFKTERIIIDEIVCSYEDQMTIYELGIYSHWDKDYTTVRNNFSD
ncbi:MAG: hypothetical protein ISR78_09400 [Spirochaetia bacterium]|nr:hypothetical protein [Spirochaetia bacterium]